MGRGSCERAWKFSPDSFFFSLKWKLRLWSSAEGNKVGEGVGGLRKKFMRKSLGEWERERTRKYSWISR